LNNLLPELIKGDLTDKGKDAAPRTIRVWSAGCSIGAEPYTLAILLEELAAHQPSPKFTYQILCTDIDSAMLQRARDGVSRTPRRRKSPKTLLFEIFSNI